LGEDAGGDERWRTQPEDLPASLTERGIAGGHEDGGRVDAGGQPGFIGVEGRRSHPRPGDAGANGAHRALFEGGG
jgi:hypothetical protein